MKLKQLPMSVRFSAVLALAGLAGGGLAACNSSSSSPAVTAPTTLTGIFVDAPVAGIGYRTESIDDQTTNGDGEFEYVAGENVTFYIGDVELPPVAGGEIVTPLDIFDTDDFTDQKVVNLARLLQSLDVDGDPSNGITLTSAAHTAAAGLAIDFDVPTAEFEADPDVINFVSSGGGEGVLVSADAAVAHLQGISLVGAWHYIDEGASEYITIAFMADGTYMHAEHATSGPGDPGHPGIEYGTYGWNPVSRLMSVETSVDTNGAWGLSHAQSGETFTRVGSVLMIDDPDTAEEVALELAASDSNPLVGGWVLDLPEEDTVVVIVFTESHFSLAEFAPATESGETGAEFGSYSWDENSGAFIPVVLVDQNGDWGFSDEPAAITAEVAGNELTLDFGGDDTVTFSRVR